MQINVVSTPNSAASVVVIPLVQNEHLTQKLTQLAADYQVNASLLVADFKAEAKQTHLLYAGSQRIFLLGMGKKVTEAGLIKTFRSFFYHQKKNGAERITVDVVTAELSMHLEAIVNGIVLSNYELDLYKTDKKNEETFFTNLDAQLDILVDETMLIDAQAAAQRGEETAWTQMSVMDLGNAPGNKKYPQILADWAVESGELYGYDVQVFDENQCEEAGLHALLSVSKGSANPPRFIILEYKHPEATRKIGLVGKGVTFDTGGVSIKASANMSLMKSDMGGAAAVFGAIELAAKLELPIHLIAAVPTTENCVDGLSTKPGDVIDSYAGKTIEVIDTDAEGRIILADGLAYLNRKYAPDVLIDLATLTGSCVATLGYAAAGLFTNNDELAQQLYDAGQATGEKVWRLPLWDDYQDDIKSDVADVKNFHGKPIAGAIVAGKFLEVFTENHPAWAHLDIAGTAFTDSEYGTMKSASAYGVRLLTRFLQNTATPTDLA